MSPKGYRECRKAAGMSAQVAATKLGVSITTLLNWERGVTSPSAVRVLSMSKLYGVNADQLICCEETRPQ